MARKASALGMPAHVVGGAVRDAALGRSVADVDLVIEGKAIALGEALVAEQGGTLRRHGPFGTATWVSPSGVPVDLATSRTETYESPGQLPRVRPAPIAADLHRRDFSINAMAVTVGSMGGSGAGTLRDPHGGLADLLARRIRVLHRLSFLDDPTRLWRAARFSGRLGLRMERHTASWRRAAVEAGALATLTPARVGAEVDKALAEASLGPVLDHARKWGLLAAFEPGLRCGSGRIRRLVAQRAALIRASTDLSAAGWSRPDLRQGLWILLGAPLPADARDALVPAVPGDARFHARWRAGLEPICRAVDGLGRLRRRASVGRRLEDLDEGQMALALALAEGEGERAISWWIAEGHGIKAAVNGHDLMAAGVRPGPSLGRALAAALNAARDGADAATQRQRAFRASRLSGGGEGSR